MAETLFSVYVINPHSGEVVIGREAVMAENEKDAIRQAGVEQVADDIGVQLEELLVYASKVGEHNAW